MITLEMSAETAETLHDYLADCEEKPLCFYSLQEKIRELLNAKVGKNGYICNR